MCVCVSYARASALFERPTRPSRTRSIRYKKNDAHTKTGSHRACSCRTVAMGCPYQSRHGSHDMRSIAYATRAGYTAHGCAVYGIGDVAWMDVYRACSDIRCASTTRQDPCRGRPRVTVCAFFLRGDTPVRRRRRRRRRRRVA